MAGDEQPPPRGASSSCRLWRRENTKLGEDYPDTLASVTDLASTYWKQGRWEEAEQLQVQMMEASKTKLGAGHPDTLAHGQPGRRGGGRQRRPHPSTRGETAKDRLFCFGGKYGGRTVN